MKGKQLDVFRDTEEGKALVGSLTLDQAINLSLQGLREVGGLYDKWLIGFSGGKDSTAVIGLLEWAFQQGPLQRPKHLIVNNNDTLMELPPLQQHTDRILSYLQSNRWEVYKTIPKLRYIDSKGNAASGRFWVNLLGIGYAPPNSRFTWCRQRMKLNPLEEVFNLVQQSYAGQTLTIDGVRIGESAVRDKAIYSSCRKDDGECGSTLLRDVATGLNLSPVAHWRVCHVFDWLIRLELEFGIPVLQVLEIYGATISDGVEDLSSRTGCFGCPLVTAGQPARPRSDKALERILQLNEWSHLAPLLKLGPLYWRLHYDYSNRHIWDANQKGNPKRHGKPGCLTLDARKQALEEVLSIEEEVNALAKSLGREPLTIIRQEELDYIYELWEMRYHPGTWSEDDLTGVDVVPFLKGQTSDTPLLSLIG